MGDPPEIRQWLERASAEEQRYHRMAALLWEEIGLRRRDGQMPLPIDYEALARDDVQRRVIKEVFRQSQRLPLFSARHLFLVMAVVTLPIAIAIAWWLPHATLRFWLGMLLRRLGTIDSSDEPSLPEEALVLVVDRSQWLDRWGVRILVGRPLTEVFFEPAANSRAPRRGERGVIRIAGGPAGRQMGLALARRTLLHGGTLLVHAKSQEETTEGAFPEEAVKLVEGIRIRCVPICVAQPLPETGFRWSTLVPRWLRRRRFRFGDPAPLEPAVPAEFHRRIQALRD